MTRPAGDRKPVVLFVCIHNAGRSVMAQAFASEDGDGAIVALSAGTIPSGEPHREVVESMKEVGIDISGHSGTLLTDAIVEAADRVITMGCDVDSETCPAIRYKDVEDWGLPDPKGQRPVEVASIRDEIRRRVKALMLELR